MKKLEESAMKKMIGVAIIAMAMAGAARADIVLSIFDNLGFDYGYSSWTPLTNAITLNPTYVSVGGTATETGGAGVNLAAPVTFDTNTHLLRVSARIGPGNLASGFNVILQTSPSDLWGYYFPATLFNTSTFTPAYIAVTNYTFVSGSPDFATNGMIGWQIQGDFSSTDDFRFDFDDARLVVPEPGTLALLAIGILSFVARSVRGMKE